VHETSLINKTTDHSTEIKYFWKYKSYTNLFKRCCLQYMYFSLRSCLTVDFTRLLNSTTLVSSHLSTIAYDYPQRCS